ncbi:hypothetical protein LTR56_014942 [Elasticomyces elasticus]|nr:hypothetical protein LTR56_014942 [Elasticomyces elasticus]KAK3656280.1 hypothetical protein LTR22_009854 [Elasticomyces elasticus]KAK4924480.1 hypothetical protein LTR49_008369 [Elasticomyces elasticus]KAK5761678.1 hypothetical protein LTS12_008110 [Elasticomyces elasticus]
MQCRHCTVLATTRRSDPTSAASHCFREHPHHKTAIAQTISESLHDEEGNEDSTAKQAAAPGTYGDDENASQNEPLPKDDIDDTTTTSNDALAPTGYGSGESATDNRTIPQAGQDDDKPLCDANTANNTTANEAPASAEYGDDERANVEPGPRGLALFQILAGDEMDRERCMGKVASCHKIACHSNISTAEVSRQPPTSLSSTSIHLILLPNAAQVARLTE